MTFIGPIVMSIIFAALVWWAGGPTWVCTIVLGWTFMLIWIDTRLGLVVGEIQDLRAQLKLSQPDPPRP